MGDRTELAHEAKDVLTSNCRDRHGGAFPNCDECSRYYPLLCDLAAKLRDFSRAGDQTE